MACPSAELAELIAEHMRDCEDFVREQRIQRFSSPAWDDGHPWFGSVVSSDAALATPRAELTSNLNGDDWLPILTQRKREIDAFRNRCVSPPAAPTVLPATFLNAVHDEIAAAIAGSFSRRAWWKLGWLRRARRGAA